MKCERCGAEFERNKYAVNQKYCSECKPIVEKEYYREYYQKNLERIKLNRKKREFRKAGLIV